MEHHSYVSSEDVYFDVSKKLNDVADLGRLSDPSHELDYEHDIDAWLGLVVLDNVTLNVLDGYIADGDEFDQIIEIAGLDVKSATVFPIMLDVYPGLLDDASRFMRELDRRKSELRLTTNSEIVKHKAILQKDIQKVRLVGYLSLCMTLGYLLTSSLLAHGACSSTELVPFDKDAGVMPVAEELNRYVAFDTEGKAYIFDNDEKPIFSNGRIKLLSDYRDGWPAEKKYWELGSSLNWGDGKTPPRASGEISDTEYSGPFCD